MKRTTFYRFVFVFGRASHQEKHIQTLILQQTLLMLTAESYFSNSFYCIFYLSGCLSCPLPKNQSEAHISNWIYRYRLLCTCTWDYPIKSQALAALAGNYRLCMFTSCEAIMLRYGSECLEQKRRQAADSLITSQALCSVRSGSFLLMPLCSAFIIVLLFHNVCRYCGITYSTIFY